MVDIATHVRIFEMAPTDDLVEKRTAAVKELGTRFSQRETVSKILQLANDLSVGIATKGKIPDALAEEIGAAIKEQSASFVLTGQEIQVLACALMGSLQVLEAAKPSSGVWSRHDVLAAGLWSALSFQPALSEPKLEALRTEMLTRSRNQIVATSSSARKRVPVSDFSVDLSNLDEEWTNFAARLKAGTEETIAALRTNAALDREEIDLLWWVLADRSALLEARLSSLPPATAAVASGLEAARLLRRLPGDAHHHLVTRNIANGEPLNLVSLIRTMGEDRTKVTATFQEKTMLSRFPAVFPLLSAITTGHVLQTGTRKKQSLSDWAGRALLEGAILHLSNLPSDLV
jgi:hypothetical protein